MINISYLVKDKYTGESVRYEKQLTEGTDIQKEKQKLIDSGATGLKIKITDNSTANFDRTV